VKSGVGHERASLRTAGSGVLGRRPRRFRGQEVIARNQWELSWIALVIMLVIPPGAAARGDEEAEWDYSTPGEQIA
jgi:hypothetical protein